jgi:ferric-dicitrate binding protein FerR (iron transport regulator)
LHADDRNSVDVAEAEVAAVSGYTRRREMRELGVGELVDVIERVAEATEPAAEDHTDAWRRRGLLADGSDGLVEPLAN